VSDFRLKHVCISSIPTIGFNTKRVQKGHVTLKWLVIFHLPMAHFLTHIQLGPRGPAALSTDVGAILQGGECDSVGHIVQLGCGGADLDSYIVDAADKPALPVATEELHDLLNKPTLDGIPLLVLGNKSDLPDKLSVDELIDQMNLKSITRREVSCYGISAKEETNLDAVLHWLIARASR
jgi:ADP-ribosylation factor-like protein 8